MFIRSCLQRRPNARWSGASKTIIQYGKRLSSSDTKKPEDDELSIVMPNFKIAKPKEKAKDLTWEEKRAISFKIMAQIADSQKDEIIGELQEQLNNENILESQKEFIQWQIDNFDKLKAADVGFIIGRRYKYLDRYYDPFQRTKNILRDDLIDTYFEFKGKFQRFTDQLRDIDRPLYMYRNERRKIFPEHPDVTVIGGGMMGMSVALHMKDSTDDARIVVVEKDLSYRDSSSANYTGEICYEYEDEQDFRISTSAVDFMRRSVNILSHVDQPLYKMNLNLVGHLTLASHERIDDLFNSFCFQRYHGIHVKMLTKNVLQQKFPWMNTEGIEGGLYTIQKAGWYEPYDYLTAVARKAKLIGVEIVEGEVIGSTLETEGDWELAFESEDFAPKQVDSIHVRLPDGDVKSISSHSFILACGHQSKKVGELIGMGGGEGPYQIGVPTRKHTQRLYAFYAPKGPSLLLPFLKDTCGLFVRREGLADQYVCGRAYPIGEEPDLTLSPEEYFYQQIHPVLAERVPGFKEVRLLRSWVRCFNRNPTDGKGLLGMHPVIGRTQVACGFSHGGPYISMCAGKYLTDIMLGQHAPLIEMKGYNYDRLYPGVQRTSP